MIRAIKVPIGDNPKVINIEPTLQSFQDEIGSTNIELYFPFDDDAALICNELGVTGTLEPNRIVFDQNDESEDLITGDFLIVNTNLENEDNSFCDLDELQIKKYIIKFSVTN